MALILGTLQDKRGNALPNVKVIARIASNPSGDTGEDITDALGHYNISVSNTGTEYYLYVESESGGVSGHNFSSSVVSSGDTVSSFTLCADSNWKSEHYGSGEAHTCGEHKDLNVDSVKYRTTGYSETTDSYMEWRIGSTNSRLRIVKSSGVLWLNPRAVVGFDDLEIGLAEDYASADQYFYWGSAKTYWQKTDGTFNLQGGTITGSVAAQGDWTFTGTNVVFTNHPQQSAYVAPTLDVEYAPKKYVDDQVAGGGGGGGSVATVNVKVEMHKITSGENTSGYFDLSEIPVDEDDVMAWFDGSLMVNKKIVGATGATPDFDIINDDEFHFNNNGPATGLSEFLDTDDIITIFYEVSASS